MGIVQRIRNNKRLQQAIILLAAVLLLIFSLAACNNAHNDNEGAANGIVSTENGHNSPEQADNDDGIQPADVIDKDGSYNSAEEVALYIHTYGCLPGNYITKKEARQLGWQSGSLDAIAEGKSIGGDHFGNYEGKLPDKEGRVYTECDIDTDGKKSRGAKRIVFSNDGLIYYTEDHYASFTLLYGTP